MAGAPENLERGWWVAHMVQAGDGTWDVGVMFRDGSSLQLSLEPSRDLDLAIAAAVKAHQDGDVRWTPRSERGR